MYNPAPLRRCALSAALACIFACALLPNAHADAPHTIPFQAVVKLASGTPITAPTPVTFSLYGAATGGAALWTEAQTVSPGAGGLVAVQLGSVTSLAGVPFNQPYFVGINMNGNGEMSPRLPLASVPYALFAQNVADNAVTPATLSAGDYSAKINAGAYNIRAAGLTPKADARSGLKGADVPFASAGIYFGTFGNNGVAPFADILAFNSGQDLTGGPANALFLRKDTIGMRVYQGTGAAADTMSSYKDVAMLGDPAQFGATTVNGSLTISGSGHSLQFADGTTQATAQLVGPQGPQGAAGPQGPAGNNAPTPPTPLPGPASASNIPVITIDGMSYDSTTFGVVTLAEPFTWRIPVAANGTFTAYPSTPGTMSSLVLRRIRPFTSSANRDAAWYQLSQPTSSPHVHDVRITVYSRQQGAKGPEICRWDFSQGFISSYKTTYQGIGSPLIETLSFEFSNMTRKATPQKVQQPQTTGFKLAGDSVYEACDFESAQNVTVNASPAGANQVAGKSPGTPFADDTYVFQPLDWPSGLFNWFLSATTATNPLKPWTKTWATQDNTGMAHQMIVSGANAFPSAYSFADTGQGIGEVFLISTNAITTSAN